MSKLTIALTSAILQPVDTPLPIFLIYAVIYKPSIRLKIRTCGFVTLLGARSLGRKASVGNTILRDTGRNIRVSVALWLINMSKTYLLALYYETSFNHLVRIPSKTKTKAC